MTAPAAAPPVPKCAECGLTGGHKMSCSTGGGWYPPGKELPRRTPGRSIANPDRAHWPRDHRKRKEVMPIHIGDNALMQRFQDAESFGKNKPGKVCDGCAREGAAPCNDHRGRALALHICTECRARLRSLRAKAEARRKARETNGKGKR